MEANNWFLDHSSGLWLPVDNNLNRFPVTAKIIDASGTAQTFTDTVPVEDESEGAISGGVAGTVSKLGGQIYNSTLPTLTTGQQGALQGDSRGRLITRSRAEQGSDEYTHWPFTKAAGASSELIAAPGTGKKIRVYQICATMTLAGTVDFLSAATSLIGGPMVLPTGGAFPATIGINGNPLFECGTNEALNIAAVTGGMSGFIKYLAV